MKPTGRSLDYELTSWITAPSWIAAPSASDRAADELNTHRTVPLPSLRGIPLDLSPPDGIPGRELADLSQD